MSTWKNLGSAFLKKGLLLTTLLAGFAVLLQQAPAVPDRPAPEGLAQTQVVINVPGKVATFANHQLEVILYEYDPRVKGKETLIDKQIKKAFGHNQGADTALRITLGASAQLKPEMHYYVTVDAFNAAGKRTHLGEKDANRAICNVLTAGKPNQVAMIVRPASGKDIVMDIADEIKKGNDPKAEKMAQARAKDFEELYDVENLHRPRGKGGMGWGTTPGNIPNQDALEIKLRNLARAVPANFNQDAKNNEEAAYWIAALAELTAAKPEFKPMGKKSLKDWKMKAAQVRTEADAFAKAVAANNALAIRNGALAITNACNVCHAVYRE